MKEIIEEGIVKKMKMKMMMSKQQRSRQQYSTPSLTVSSARMKKKKTKSHRASLFKPFPCLFSKEEEKKEQKGRKTKY